MAGFLFVRLFAFKEGGRSKSHRYWPKLGSKHSSATYGKFKVTTKFRTDSGCYATTGLKVKHLLSGQERTVWHLQYTDWPDHGCPEEVQGFLCKISLTCMIKYIKAKVARTGFSSLHLVTAGIDIKWLLLWHTKASTRLYFAAIWRKKWNSRGRS